jgi:predicted transcriptional regulator
MARNHISIVPVLGDDRRLIGVVSASDLLARISGDRGEIPRGHRLATMQERHRKSHASTATELMTAPAITVGQDTTIADAARQCAKSHVRCMPVLNEAGDLVGIVSRTDLLKPYLREDNEIGRELVDEVIPAQCNGRAKIHVTVGEGMVTLTGTLAKRSDLDPLIRAVQQTAGVVAVQHGLTFRTDDRPDGPDDMIGAVHPPIV